MANINVKRVQILITCSICLLLSTVIIAVPGPYPAYHGDGGLLDSSVERKLRNSIGQDGAIGRFRSSSRHYYGDLLYSEAIYFSAWLDADCTIYTRGIKNLEDSTWWAAKYLDMEDYIGQWVTAVVYEGATGTIYIDVEQMTYPDSTLFWGDPATHAGWNQGYYKTTALFGTGLVMGGGVEIDSFQILLPVVRWMIREDVSAATDTFHVVWYVHRQVDEYGAPGGEGR